MNQNPRAASPAVESTETPPDAEEVVYFEGSPALRGSLGNFFILTRSMRYRISNYRIDYERGVFSKDIDTLELWHVEDLKFHQSLLDRILRIGGITVVSHDDTTPKLLLRALPNPRPIYEQLRDAIIDISRQRGVIVE